MNTTTPSPRRFAVLFNRYKTLPKGKMIRVTITGFIVALFIIVAIVDMISPRNIIGIQLHKASPVQPGVYDTSKDDFDPTTFTSSTLSENSPNGVVVTVGYPTTGTEKLDDAIRAGSQQFAATVASQSSTNETYTATPFAYDKYVFVTFSNTNPATTAPVFTTIGFTKKGLLTESLFTKPGYESVITNYVTNALNSRFQTQLEVGTVAVQKALTEKTYRLASNGLVVQMPTKLVTNTDIGATYYEVLVPNDVLKEYLE